MTLLIRRAVAGEEVAVSRLLAETWHHTHDAEIGSETVSAITAKWHAPALLRQQIDDPSRCFLVAESGNGSFAGHALSWVDKENCVNLLRLYVLPAFRKRGIGTQLYGAAWKRAEERGRNIFTLSREPHVIAMMEKNGMTLLRSPLQAPLSIHLYMNWHMSSRYRMGEMIRKAKLTKGSPAFVGGLKRHQTPP